MKKHIKQIAASVLTAALLLTGNGCVHLKTEKEQVTLNVWHVYGGQTDSPLNELIDRFNRAQGADPGIQVVVTSVSNTNTIHEAVIAAVGDEPDAPELPDLFISYPKTIAMLGESLPLVDYRDYFTEEELSAYIPAFLEEGTVDGKLVVFPVSSVPGFNAGDWIK